MDRRQFDDKTIAMMFQLLGAYERAEERGWKKLDNEIFLEMVKEKIEEFRKLKNEFKNS